MKHFVVTVIIIAIVGCGSQEAEVEVDCSGSLEEVLQFRRDCYIETSYPSDVCDKKAHRLYCDVEKH